jgi:hypothetical protein
MEAAIACRAFTWALKKVEGVAEWRLFLFTRNGAGKVCETC